MSDEKITEVLFLFNQLTHPDFSQLEAKYLEDCLHPNTTLLYKKDMCINFIKMMVIEKVMIITIIKISCCDKL